MIGGDKAYCAVDLSTELTPGIQGVTVLFTPKSVDGEGVETMGETKVITKWDMLNANAEYQVQLADACGSTGEPIIDFAADEDGEAKIFDIADVSAADALGKAIVLVGADGAEIACCTADESMNIDWKEKFERRKEQKRRERGDSDDDAEGDA